MDKSVSVLHPRCLTWFSILEVQIYGLFQMIANLRVVNDLGIVVMIAIHQPLTLILIMIYLSNLELEKLKENFLLMISHLGLIFVLNNKLLLKLVKKLDQFSPKSSSQESWVLPTRLWLQMISLLCLTLWWNSILWKIILFHFTSHNTPFKNQLSFLVKTIMPTMKVILLGSQLLTNIIGQLDLMILV